MLKLVDIIYVVRYANILTSPWNGGKMIFQNVLNASQKYLPKLHIQYKDQSLFMKILGKMLFFNPSFLRSYVTTVGNTIYFPNKNLISSRPISSTVALLHELVHLYDCQQYGMWLFWFLYLFPQILGLLALPLLLISWKLALLFLLFFLPFPAFFRMKFERRAFLAVLYILQKLGQKFQFNPELERHQRDFLSQFKGSHYYFMWSFNGLVEDFEKAMIEIQADHYPFSDPIFAVLDELIAAA